MNHRPGTMCIFKTIRFLELIYLHTSRCETRHRLRGFIPDHRAGWSFR